MQELQKNKINKSLSEHNRRGHAAVIILSVFVEAGGLCNQYFAWKKLIKPFE